MLMPARQSRRCPGLSDSAEGRARVSLSERTFQVERKAHAKVLWKREGDGLQIHRKLKGRQKREGV